MAIVAQPSEMTASFEPCPAGVHSARLIALAELGPQKTDYGVKDQLLAVFALDAFSGDAENGKDRYYARTKINFDPAKLGSKSKMVVLWAAIHNLSADDMVKRLNDTSLPPVDFGAAVESEELQLQLQMVHTEVEKEGKKRVYSNIAAFLPPPVEKKGPKKGQVIPFQLVDGEEVPDFIAKALNDAESLYVHPDFAGSDDDDDTEEAK